jgi:NADH:ubiquinone oxidoreductase subunit K
MLTLLTINLLSLATLISMPFDNELLLVALCLVLLGFIGLIESREFVSILINIELLLLGINFYFITYGLL